MLASLLRPKKRRVYADRSPFSSLYTQDAPSLLRPNAQNNDYYRDYMIGNNLQDNSDQTDEDDQLNADLDDPESAPLLPIFSASHLGTKARPEICILTDNVLDRCAARL